MEEELWSARQQSTRFHELVEETQSVWRDEAARAVEQRWLAPHREHDSHMIDSFAEEMAQLGEATQSLLVGDHHLALAQDQSNAIDGHLRGVRLALSSCHDALERTNAAIVSSRAEIRRADAGVYEADSLLRSTERTS